jgi:hypothetical protein
VIKGEIITFDDHVAIGLWAKGTLQGAAISDTEIEVVSNLITYLLLHFQTWSGKKKCILAFALAETMTLIKIIGVGA